MEIELLRADRLDEQGTPIGYRHTVRVSELEGWLVVFDRLFDSEGEVSRLLIEPDPGWQTPRAPLTTSSLRQINPGGLIRRVADEGRFMLEDDVIFTVPPGGVRMRRSDEYMAKVAGRLIELQQAGVKRGAYSQLAVEFDRRKSQIADDARKAREDGWTKVVGEHTQGRTMSIEPGPLLIKWLETGS
jgi:hypothetical protein